MKNFSLLFVLSVVFFSCQQKENKNTSIQTADPDPVVTTQIENTEVNKQTGDTIFLNTKNEKGIYTAEASIDSTHSRIYVKFKNDYAGELTGKIIPEQNSANIRFNQIIFPDKSSDGPFGTDLKTNIKQKGNYVLVIGHSQMAENPYYGKFKIELENRKTD
ncbi:hypothetical protein [Flavobacterium ginsengiterrae]|uniref:CHRD domain-containing protein n=1 Tax=Flavobacterium ginsengiterrae TaxID=871695 RepID=A0ABP7G7S4_9FLAO